MAGTVVITCHAGFMGFPLSQAMLGQGWRVVGIDDHNDYYDPRLKAAREARLTPSAAFRPVRGGIEEPGLLDRIFADRLRKQHKPVVLLANKSESQASGGGVGEAHALGF